MGASVALAALAVGLTGVATAARAQQPAATPDASAAQPAPRAERLRGRVTHDSTKAPIAGAMVTVTMGPARTVRVDTTRADGTWAIAFAEGTGDFLVHVAAPGFGSARKRVTRGAPGFPGDVPAGTEAVYVVDLALKPVPAQQLATVKVEAKRERPSRDEGREEFEPRGGASERAVGRLEGTLAPDQKGDLTAMAATLPGVTPAAGGITALGIGGQNAVTLGGLNVAGLEFPREARTATRVATTAYDPARGWFGGAAIDVTISPGDQFASRSASLTGDLPALQATDAAGRALGAPVAGVQASAGGTGTWNDDRWTYNLAGQFARRRQDAPSLLDAPPLALALAGVAPDSAARLVALARARGIPLAAADAADARLSDAASFVLRIDRPRYDFKKYEPRRTTWGVTTFGSTRRSDALGVSPTAAPSAGGEQATTAGGVQAEWSRYAGKRDWLLEARSGLSLADDRRTAWAPLPGATVLVGAAPLPGEDAAPGALRTLALGGNGALAGRRRTLLWESQAQLRLVPQRRFRHLVTVTADARWDALREEPGADRFGTFTYRSLDDLAAGRAASFARTLDVPTREAGVWNGFLSVGDRWRVRDALRVEYGVRLEGTRYATTPAANAAVARALGVRTDVVPNGIGLSPRFGFTWTRKERGTSVWGSPLGMYGFSGSHVIRGGIGEFRSFLGPDLVTSALARTGLAGGEQRLLCVGDAVPAAAASDWAAWDAGSALPASCVGGTNAFRDAAPAVVALDPRYVAPRSWRANLAWSADRWKVAWTVEGIVSLNRHQPGSVDANFAATPRFATGDEGRPVFVPASDVVPATGALVATAARVDPAFARVLVQRSDLRSTSTQLVVSLRPERPFPKNLHLSGSYVLGNVRQQFRGFDGAAFGDPRAVEWARGDLDVRHQFLVNAGITRKRVTLALFGRVQSGTPFTPLVGGDVNGDGLGGDRAFVFDPAAAGTEAEVATGMRDLLARAPGHVRRCLGGGLGAAATRNACAGPWTASMNARLAWDAPSSATRRRRSIALNLANPLGGLDALFHGANLRGWGAAAFPDPVLYQVRGFDPAARRFAYAVNPRFGDTRPRATAFRAPFRVTLDASVDLGPPLPQQQIDRWLKPGRGGRPGARLTEAELLKRYTRNIPDPFGNTLRMADSLLLTRAQVESLTVAQSRFKAARDSLFQPYAAWMAALPDRWDGAEVLRRQEATTDAGWEVAWRESRATFPRLLTPQQLRLVGWPASEFLKQEKPPKGWRIFYYGNDDP